MTPIRTFKHPSQNPHPFVALLQGMTQKKREETAREEKRKNLMMQALAQSGGLQPVAGEGDASYGGINYDFRDIGAGDYLDRLQTLSKIAKNRQDMVTAGQPSARDQYKAQASFISNLLEKDPGNYMLEDPQAQLPRVMSLFNQAMGHQSPSSSTFNLGNYAPAGQSPPSAQQPISPNQAEALAKAGYQWVRNKKTGQRGLIPANQSVEGDWVKE